MTELCKSGKGLPIPCYTGWRPKHMRSTVRQRGPQGSGPQGRNAKRARLGSPVDRALYTSAKGPKNNPERYAELCIKAARLVYNRDTVAVGVQQ